MRRAVEEEEEDIKDYFVPQSGNVAFASAHDGWAFRPHQFAELHAQKMGLKPDRLVTILWGDWTYDAKSKRAVKMKSGHLTKHGPLFVQVTPLQSAAWASLGGLRVSIQSLARKAALA